MLVTLPLVTTFQASPTQQLCASAMPFRRLYTVVAADGDGDAPPPFSFLPSDDVDAPPSPPPFSFLPQKKEKKKNAVDIQKEKDAKFLQQQKEFAKTRKDFSNQADLYAYTTRP